MADILDFLYLDLKRLESFASQLFEGLPSEATKGTGKEAAFSAGVKGGLPFLLEGSGDTSAILSANSSVTSTLHHFLVTRVLSELRTQGLLAEDPNTTEDGAFVLLAGRLQIVDPKGLAATLRVLPPMMQAVARTQSAQHPAVVAHPTADQRRAINNERQEEAAQSKQFSNFADVHRWLLPSWSATNSLNTWTDSYSDMAT